METVLVPGDCCWRPREGPETSALSWSKMAMDKLRSSQGCIACVVKGTSVHNPHNCPGVLQVFTASVLPEQNGVGETDVVQLILFCGPLSQMMCHIKTRGENVLSAHVT